MPETPTANMALIKPTDHSDTDVWGAALNAAIDLIDAHDHTTGKGVKVPSAALKINADVSWSFGGSNCAITDAKAIDFTPVAASSMTSYSSALFSNSTDSNNLYYRNSAGTNVKITDGSTLNISITGGIGGDYTSIGALFDYDDATDTYRARQQTSASVRQFAKISSANLQLFEYKAAGDPTVPTNSVRHASPAALAASYTVTWPAAVPAAAAAVQTSTAGVLTFSNTFTQPLVATEFKHSTALVQVIPANAWVEAVATHTKQIGGTSSGFYRWSLIASANRLSIPIVLPIGSRITGWGIIIDKQTNGSSTINGRIFLSSGTTGTESGQGSGNSSSANAPGFIQLLETGLSIDISGSNQYYLVFSPGNSVTPAADVLYNASISYTRP